MGGPASGHRRLFLSPPVFIAFFRPPAAALRSCPSSDVASSALTDGFPSLPIRRTGPLPISILGLPDAACGSSTSACAWTANHHKPRLEWRSSSPGGVRSGSTHAIGSSLFSHRSHLGQSSTKPVPCVRTTASGFCWNGSSCRPFASSARQAPVPRDWPPMFPVHPAVDCFQMGPAAVGAVLSQWDTPEPNCAQSGSGPSGCLILQPPVRSKYANAKAARDGSG